MNVVSVKQELTKKYPGVIIKENKDQNGVTTEIVGEIDRNLIDSKRAVAVAVIDKSPEHYHKVTTEEYEVIKGDLTVYLNGKPFKLLSGQKLIVRPGVKHWANGAETWIYCYSEPDWSPGDYQLVD